MRRSTHICSRSAVRKASDALGCGGLAGPARRFLEGTRKVNGNAVNPKRHFLAIFAGPSMGATYMKNSKPQQKTFSFGGCEFGATSPSIGELSPDTRMFNLTVPFEEALKLHLAIG